MRIEYEELFKATLSMFGLTTRNGGAPSAEFIQKVFNEVLKADDLCYKDFNRHSSKAPE